MRGHVFRIHENREQLVDLGLEILDMIRQGAKKATVEIDQVCEQIVANDNGSSTLQSGFREFHRRTPLRLRDGCRLRLWHDT